MIRYALAALAMMVVFLALFGLAVAFDVPLLVDPRPQLAQGGGIAAGVGVGLLLVDVLLPVPSSLVMTAHGALFGILAGAALSLVGSVGAAALAFTIGRRGGPRLHRLVSAEDRAKADAMLRRWGGLAIVVSRPLPLLAETVAILAGTSPMRWRTLLAAALLGNLPPAVLYAVSGATAASVASGFWMFGLVLAVAGLFWFVGRRLES